MSTVSDEPEQQAHRPAARAKTGARKIAEVPPETANSFLRPMSDQGKRLAVMRAIRNVALDQTAAWRDLAKLSERTEIDEVQAVPDGLFESGEDGFRALGTAYVKLTYHRDSEPVLVRDEFSVLVQGHFEEGGSRAVIDYLSVNTPAA